jgi:hypothetical protein
MIAKYFVQYYVVGLETVPSKIPREFCRILITVGRLMDYKGLKAIPHLPKDIKKDL